MEDSAHHKNLLAIKDHSNRTREIVRDLEKQIKEYNNANKALQSNIDILVKQVQNLQVRMFSGGATS